MRDIIEQPKGKFMKLYIIPSWYPEDENDITACFFREQAHALADYGHDVTVLHIEPISVTELVKRPFHETRQWQDGTVRTIFHKVIVPIPAKAGDIQEKYISNLFLKIIKKQIEEDKKNGSSAPDILHAHVSHSCAFYCLKASKKLNISLVVTEHYSGLLLGDATEREYRRVYDTIQNSDAFIFVGSNFQKTLTQKLGTTKKTYVIPNMLPSSFVEQDDPKENSEAPNRPFTFLTACHLKKNKSVDLVIRAFHWAFGDEEQVQLIIAGDGEEKVNLEQLARELNEKRIQFIGRYSREESTKLFASADTFVLTSMVETFGIVYLEALLQGIPCIGTKGQGAEDIIDESNGILVDYGDIDLLSKAMREMKNSRHSFNRYEISKSCVERFEQNRISSRLSNCYAELIRGVIPISKDPFTFLTACHLKKHKSVDLVIRAFHEAFANGEMVRLVIAGDGSERSNLEKMVDSLNDNRISFIGRYKREDTDRIFSSADAFVLTSEVEPFGIVYIEALAHGLPCIGTKGQGADDIIDDKSGDLVEYGNIGQLADCMRGIFNNKWNRTEIREHCCEKFTQSVVSQKITEVYKAALR